jgi:hypothetical protein
MKNIMVIDGADNCVYDVFAASEQQFALIFPPGTDIAFIEDVETREGAMQLRALETLWTKRVPKAQVTGIHGLLFYGLLQKRQYYPTLRDEEAINPDGSRLR